MPRDIHYIPNFLASIEIDGEILADVIAAAISSGSTNEEEVRDLIGSTIVGGTKLTAVVDDGADTVTLNLDTLTDSDISNFASAVNALITAATIDADTLGGDTKASIISQAVASVVGGASAAYDTLVELQALMEADDTQTSGMLTSIAGRARFYAAALASGSPTATVTHNLNLTNIHDFTYRVIVTATGAEEGYEAVGATADTITITDETGENIATGRRIFVTAGV